MNKSNSRANEHGGGESGVIRLVMIVGLAAVTLALAGSLSSYQTRRAAEKDLVEAGRELYGALEAYALDEGTYPSNGDPLQTAFVPDSLEPLVREGAVTSPHHITEVLRDRRVSVYCSPDRPTRNSDFWAVLVSAEDPNVKALVADTDQYPGREGERLRGVYLLRGGQWVERGI